MVVPPDTVYLEIMLYALIAVCGVGIMKGQQRLQK